MSKKALYPPLKLIQDMEKTYPNVFQLYEQEMQKRGKHDLPFDIASDIGETYFPNPEQREEAEVCSLSILLIGEWRASKQVYSFSHELLDLLYDTEEFKMDEQLFEYLPYSCFYLEIPNDQHVHGVFIKYINDIANHHLIFLVLCSDGTFCYNIFPISSNENFYQRVTEYAENFQDAKYRPLLKKSLILGFQAAMYLCSKNCDISENPLQQKIYRPPTTIRNRFSEIRKWDVGYRVVKGITISAIGQSAPINPKGAPLSVTRNRPRQHWRRAHWHTYWVGKGRTTKELRFIAPILVNDNNDDVPIVEHVTAKP